MKKIAINELGRIGRAAMKLIIGQDELELVAVNDIVPVERQQHMPIHPVSL